MTSPSLGKILAVILAIGVIAWGLDAYHQRKGTVSEHDAAVAAGEAQTHEAQARATDPEIQNLKAKGVAREAELVRVSGERDALLKKWQARPIPPATLPPSTPDDRQTLLDQLGEANELIEKDAEEIDKLKADAVVKDFLITAQTKRGDEWEAACHARERQAQAQEVATNAWKKAVTASKWQGRVEGFAVGLASGYVAGRLH